MEGPPAGSGLKIKPNQKSVKGRLSRGQGVGEEGREGCGGGRGGRKGGRCVCVCVCVVGQGRRRGRTDCNKQSAQQEETSPSLDYCSHRFKSVCAEDGDF